MKENSIFQAVIPPVELACNVYYLNGVSHCRTCGREWRGSASGCQKRKTVMIIHERQSFREFARRELGRPVDG